MGSLYLWERANVVLILPSRIETEWGIYVLVELDDLIVARLQKIAKREGISMGEVLENLIALYGATCD